MASYIIRRLLLMIPTLLGVTAVVFFIMAWSPGGFGGVTLSDEGAQTQGDEARRIQQYLKRRYGLDQPTVVQYGRWLNQVSPVGFRMSADVSFTDAQRQQTHDLLANTRLASNPQTLNRAADWLLNLSAYTGQPIASLTRQLDQALNDPAQIPNLFALCDAPQVPRWITDDPNRLARDPASTDKRLIDDLIYESSGRNRVLFRQPIVKMPDLGTSLRGRSVVELLAEAAPITVLLNGLTLPLIYSIALLAGVYAARWRGGWFDVSSGFVFLALWSVPVMWAGVLMMGYLASKQNLYWFPTGGLHDLRADTMAFLPRYTDDGFARGWLLDVLWHLALPVFCLTYGGFAFLAKLTRGAVLENLHADFVRTARAKGVKDRHILFRHVMRNSILPLITVFVSLLPAMFAGSVIVETIFSIPGMGRLGVEAAFQKDREVVMGTLLLASMLSLMTLLMRDVLYAIADPRVSYD